MLIFEFQKLYRNYFGIFINKPLLVKYNESSNYSKSLHMVATRRLLLLGAIKETTKYSENTL